MPTPPGARANHFTVAFDLDGTLVDTAPDLTRALNHTLTAAGRPTLPGDTVRHLVGRGARVLIERGMTTTGTPATPEAVEDLLAIFLSYYAENVCIESRPFPGVPEVLHTLAEAGHTLAVCTNKPQVMTDALLAALDLDRHFAAIVGADSVPARKPDPGHLRTTIEDAGGTVPHAVLVGDSETDVATARNLGVPVVVVSFGYTSVPPAELGGDHVIDTLHAVPGIVRALRTARLTA